ncbi:MAG: trypsin-like serine protease [Polyangiaceae bacterium]
MTLWSRLSPVAFLGLLAVSACASSDEQSEDDIQRGNAARSYLAVGMVRFRSGNFGTGALIRPNVVLTAGHVAVGSVDRFYYGSPPPGKMAEYQNLPSVKIVDKALGECYEWGTYKRPATCVGDLDVGLVKLEKAIPDVTPLRMYEGAFEWLEGALKKQPETTAVGFGCHTLPDGKQRYEERRYAKSIFESLTPTQIVVLPGTGIASGGDSGGPLLYNSFIIGTVRGPNKMTTDGNPCGRAKEEYVRIDRTREWVKKILAQWGAL